MEVVNSMGEVAIPLQKWIAQALDKEQARIWIEVLNEAGVPTSIIEAIVDASEGMEQSKSRAEARILLNFIRDSLSQGWNLISSKTGDFTLQEPNLEDNATRRKHLQAFSPIVEEQHAVESVSEFLTKIQPQYSDFISDPKTVATTYDKLKDVFGRLRVVSLDESEMKPQEEIPLFAALLAYTIQFNAARSMSFVVELDNEEIIGIFQLSSPTMWMSGRDGHLGFQNLDRIQKFTQDGSKAKKRKESKREWITRIRQVGIRDSGHPPHPNSGHFTVSEFHESMIKALSERLQDLPLSKMKGIGKKWKTYGLTGSNANIEKMVLTKKMISKRERIFRSAFEALENLSRINAPTSVEDLWEIIHGSRRDKKALKSYKQAMREQKTRMISAGFVTDISVCGAIPPYNDLRVGKLIAMLTFSNEVSRYWNEKYAGKKSVIASELG